MTASYNSNNRLTIVSYDGNGNTSLASGYSYGYTVENKLNSRVSQYWPYGETLYGNDPSGRRVMKLTNPDPNNYEGEDNPLWEFYFYTINGQRLVTIDCNNANAQYQPNCWPVGENTYFGRRMLVSNGVYVVTDRLGTVRANTQGESFAYYPFGEERTSTVDGRDKFATYFRDTVGLDYAEQRYYGAGTGSFSTPDPGGIKTANSGNPASWNRYAYTLGDPINMFDPTGTYPCGSQWASDSSGNVSVTVYDCSYGGSGGDGPTARPMSDSDQPGGGGGGPASPPTTASLSPDCKHALAVAGQNASAITRALADESILQAAVQGTDIPWTMLAAIGVRETGFQNIAETGGGSGRGVFQIDIGKNPSVTQAQAYDVTFAADWAANLLNSDMETLAAKYPNLAPMQLLKATAASYNFGTGNISGNPATIDRGSTHNNYGGNVLGLMKCF
jgi:RHS repeat-associated protein